MTELDAIFRPLATELLGEFGKTVVLKRKGQGTYDPATSKTTGKAPQEVTIKALVEDYNLQGSGQAFSAGLIETGDHKVTIAAEGLPFEPSSGDYVEIDVTDYHVLNVKAAFSGEQIATYELQARR